MPARSVAFAGHIKEQYQWRALAPPLEPAPLDGGADGTDALITGDAEAVRYSKRVAFSLKLGI